MKINTKAEDTLVTRIFREGTKLRDEGLIIESIDVTQAEYDQLVRETGDSTLSDLFGAELHIDGIRVPDPVERILAQAQAEAERKAGRRAN